jgi:hypothetical protein
MIPIAVVSNEEAEKATFVVCLRLGEPSPFTDNEYGKCAHCGHGIFFRPYVPTTPPKICLQCAIDFGRGGKA